LTRSEPAITVRAMRVGIVVFPGSNCDHDAVHAVQDVCGHTAVPLWHKQHDLQGVDAVILPGGFSYGDYLRCGAIAALAPIMAEVRAFAGRGGPVLGICNGFQILCESGLLPGVLLRNASLQFRCEDVLLKVENAGTRFTRKLDTSRPLRVPIAHADGNYTCDDATLERLEGGGQVVLRYVDAAGAATAEANPNGSRHNIAGIVSAQGNVMGLMPHPERACEPVLGSADGLGFFQSLLT
jgi:phosphoribosylformylglycinamidine synthase